MTTFARFLNQEDSELYFLYGKLVYEGTGCKKDEDLGRKYLDKASALGSEDAKEFIIRLTPKKSSRLLKFEEELKDWRRKCCFAPFVSNADYDRIQTIINKYNLDILLCDLRTKGESNTEKLQSYVLSMFPN